MTSSHEQIAYEQQYADRLYARIDELITHLDAQLQRVIGEQSASTHQNRSERDSFASFYEDRVALLQSVSSQALFGRLDMHDGGRHYIGRIGVFTEDQTQLLVDWRAPAAAAFYQATPRNPLGVRLRRHLISHDRQIIGLEDDVLDSTLLDEGETSSELQGEGALLAAVTSQRTGRMGDIVATIQAEQDLIIRHPTRGALIVQGGPGTGKTAVALHRAAYQLYTYRARLEHSGVLIVAPTQGFLRYIERVLPSLGESGVVMKTPHELMPGITATGHDEPRAALIKGSLSMVKILKRAVKARQQLPNKPIPLNIDGVHITLTPQDVKAARAEARNTGRPHNAARTTFVRAALDRLVLSYQKELKRLGNVYSDEDRAELIDDLRRNHDVKVALNRCWLPYTPQSFLRSFFADRDRITGAARDLLTKKEARSLVRSKDSAWTLDDIPLLDEVAELLGEDDSAAHREEQRRSQAESQEVEYASKVLDMMGSNGIVSAADLAQHVAHRKDRRSLSERASHDRRWTYGHVVVDEAQELSPMMWRVLMRRNPTKSFTIVGDVAQTSAPAGASTWHEALEPFLEDRISIEELTVNYRTPARIMRVALRVARANGLQVSEVQSVREGERDVRVIEADAKDFAERAAEESAALLAAEGGRLAIIAPDCEVEACFAAAVAHFGADRVGAGSQGIDREISVMNTTDAKGLEFDSVVLVDPMAVLDAHRRGANDLYVAMTRATKQLSVIHAGAVPEGMEG